MIPNDSNRFARGLLRLGAAPETLVVIHAPTSRDCQEVSKTIWVSDETERYRVERSLSVAVIVDI